MYSLKKALSSIVISVLIVSGIPWVAFGGYAYLLHVREKDSKYEIVAIAQTSRNQETLKTAFLAELFGLSIDYPTNLYTFDLEEGTRKLLNFPCIHEASLRRIPPGILSVDYLLRKPVAILGDFSNTAVDAAHYAFPFHPFFSPKKLPVLLLGLTQVEWGKKIQDLRLHLAFQLLELADPLEPLQIDLSQAEASSLGDQKIIVKFSKHDVLLDPMHFKDGFIRYKEWKKTEVKDSGLTMIDLRLPGLGFVKRGGNG